MNQDKTPGTCVECGAFQAPDDLACRQCKPSYYGMAHDMRDRVTALLYILMRDHIPFGVIAQIVQGIESHDGEERFEFDLTAKGVGFYASQLATRLMKDKPKDPLA